MNPFTQLKYYSLVLLMFCICMETARSQVIIDFETGAPGWGAGGTATSGQFVLADPVGTQYQLEDDHTISGVLAAITGQNPNRNNGRDDVDGGTAQLFSPIYNVAIDSEVSVWYYFGENVTGNDPNEDYSRLFYSLDGGANWFLPVRNEDARIRPTRWSNLRFDAPAGSDVQIILISRDGPNRGEIIESGLDDFSIIAHDRITVSNVTVNETLGQATFTFTYRSRNNNTIPGGFTVNYATSNNTAIAGSDYTATSGTLNFSGTPGQELTVTVPITNDGITEPVEYFRMNITSVSTTQVQAGWYGTATISPNNVVTLNSISVDESVGTATINATYSGNTINGGFSVDFNTVDNSATAGVDYTTTAGTLNFNGNSGQTLTLNVPIIDDLYGEPEEILDIILSNISNTSVFIGDQGTITINDTDPDNAPLIIFDQFNGYFDYASTGGSLRTQPDSVDPCALTTISSNQLTTPIPPTATIEKAYLIWAHSGLTPDDQVSLDGQSVTASTINYTNNDVRGNGRSFFSMVGDVTNLVSATPNLSSHTFTFDNLTVDNNAAYCNSTIVLGGWSLFVFYEDPNLPAVRINMYNGFDFEQNSSQSFTLDDFFAINTVDAKATVLSWEGDQPLNTTESLTIETSAPGSPFKLFGDGDNNGSTLDNPFNSTIFDNTASPTVNQTNTYGVDLDTYDISPYIQTGESSVKLNVTSGNDLVLLNSVLLKVPSNLILGNVFEDINYPGGLGRDQATANGIGIDNATVELYRESPSGSGTYILEDTETSDASGEYIFGGMANGNYKVRVVNQTVRSTRGGGTACTTCIPVQTYRNDFSGGTFTDVPNEVGGKNPAGQDPGVGVIANAQSVTDVSITDQGIIGLNFGFNFSAIVNTNSSGQGSFYQFINNANALDQVGLNIEANSIFDPNPGEDVSIFTIPTSDANFNNGYFDINIDNALDTRITDTNTHIDGRTQTAFSGNTNAGTLGVGGIAVGVSGNALPNYSLPEIQIRQNNGNVIEVRATNTVIRNVAVYANTNSGILIDSGTALLTENLIGVNANGNATGQNILDGVHIIGGETTIRGNYMSRNTRAGIYANGGTSTLIEQNYMTENGATSNCNSNIRLVQGSTIRIQQNMIERASGDGIRADNTSNDVIITENTIRENGTNTSCDQTGIAIQGSDDYVISNNQIYNNQNVGVRIRGNGARRNTISQNAIYANGALGIDLSATTKGDGVTINDNGDVDNGPNGFINFPFIQTATISGTTLNVTGWVRPGSVVEFFLTDINEGTATRGDNVVGSVTRDYGEGQVFLGAATEGSGDDLLNDSTSYTDPTDGNTDTTTRFRFRIPLARAIPTTSLITATATQAGSTSEFGNENVIRSGNLITNRRITYRISPGASVLRMNGGGPQGTPTNEIFPDHFADGNGNAPFEIKFRNTTGIAIAAYEILVSGVPYATIPNLNLNGHTLQTTDNGDGTYDHLFTSSSGLNAFSSSEITSTGTPTPPGTGASCGCVTFYKL